LILLEKSVTRMVDDALHAYVSVICLTVELERLIVNRAKLMIFSYLFLLACQLQDDEIFSEHIGFDLGVMFVAAGGAVEKLLLFVDD
jgi:hypothetical protein